jgi:hypothetical protein
VFVGNETGRSAVTVSAVTVSAVTVTSEQCSYAISTLSEACLSCRAAINAQLAPEFRVYPEYIRQANRISHTCTTTSNKFGTWEPYAGGEGTSGYPKPCSAQQEAQKAFMAEVDRRCARDATNTMCSKHHATHLIP